MKKAKTHKAKRYVATITYIGRLGCGDVYTITNTGATAAKRWWKAKDKEFKAPPLRIVEAEGCLTEEELRPLLDFEFEDHDMERDDKPEPEFFNHYADAVCGGWNGWRLHAVEISTDSATALFIVVNGNKPDNYLLVRFRTERSAKIMFETENKKGETTRYLYEVEVEVDKKALDLPKLLKITERVGAKHPKEIYFRKEGWFEPERIKDDYHEKQYGNAHWWLVREYC